MEIATKKIACCIIKNYGQYTSQFFYKKKIAYKLKILKQESENIEL